MFLYQGWSKGSTFASVGLIILFGLEQPLTVGESASLRCMTNIAVSTIEWRDQSSTVLESAADQTVLNYTIDPVSDDLYGVQYTCRAVAGGTEYTQTVEIQVMSELCHSVITRHVLQVTIHVSSPSSQRVSRGGDRGVRGGSSGGWQWRTKSEV